MKINLDINIKIILLILTFSILTGIVYNSLSSKGISIFRYPKTNTWAKDSILFENMEYDTISGTGLVQESSKQNSAAKSQTTNKDSIAKIKIAKPSAQDSGPQAITLTQAYKLFRSGKTLFIDARDHWDFQDGHIKGAINIPEYKFDKNDSKLTNINKSSPIVTYCDAGDCGLSRNLAKSLFKLGFTKTYYFYEGLEAWEKANYPVEKPEAE